MKNKDNSFKNEIRQLAKVNNNITKKEEEKLEEVKLMSKIGENARIALNIMSNREER